MKVTFYCDCGAAFVARAKGPIAIEEVTALIERSKGYHLAEGHHETDAAGATAARRKAEEVESKQ